ncbi:MAG: hypothetical protein MJY81_06885 [Bacteroidaceae bacterium]|nr:hypothetical protein [Bacteroidaceae bacterium]
MKKQYTTPELKVVNVDTSAITCVSFGDGTTDTMYGKQCDGFDDEEDDLGDE